MEKLARRPQAVAAARAVRARATQLIDEDARAFSRVIRAMSQQPRLVRPRLKAAIDVPRRVHDDAQRLLALTRGLKRSIPPKYRVDLDCAEAIARAAATSARALILTNLAWLNEPAYARRLRRQLARSS